MGGNDGGGDNSQLLSPDAFFLHSALHTAFFFVSLSFTCHLPYPAASLLPFTSPHYPTYPYYHTTWAGHSYFLYLPTWLCVTGRDRIYFSGGEAEEKEDKFYISLFNSLFVFIPFSDVVLSNVSLLGEGRQCVWPPLHSLTMPTAMPHSLSLPVMCMSHPAFYLPMAHVTIPVYSDNAFFCTLPRPGWALVSIPSFLLCHSLF